MSRSIPEDRGRPKKGYIPPLMPAVTNVLFPLPKGFNPRSLHLPSHQTAIVQRHPDGKPSIRHDVSLPNPEPNQFLVKNIAVAINQCDWKMPTKFPSPGARVGCDLYGIVMAIGPEAAEIRPDIKLGDRICGAIHGSNPIDHHSGSFADYVAAYADLVIKVPETYSDAEAAAIGGTSFSTLSLALWDSLGLVGTPDTPLDASNPIPHVLVYGGSTSTGTMALQLLRLSGYKPVTTCSPRNFDLVKSYGASYVFDYNSSTCVEDIKKLTKRSLKYVLDIITDGTSQKICHQALGRSGGFYTALELPSEEFNERKRTVKLDMVVGLCALGKRVALSDGYERPANPDWRKKAGDFFQSMQKYIDSGKIRPHPARLLENKFDGLIEGIDILRGRGTSGQKLVVVLN